MRKEEEMSSTNTLRRLPVALALAGAVCAFTVPQALAGGTSTANRPQLPHSLSPVERTILQEKAHERSILQKKANKGDPSLFSTGSVPARSSVPDAFERYAAEHPFGRGVSQPADVQDRAQPPDVQDKAAALATGHGVSRPPDVQDTAAAILETPTAVSHPESFDWNDWAIGIGTGLGLALILGCGLLMGRQLRHRGIQTA
jgi:hypothetical protein